MFVTDSNDRRFEIKPGRSTIGQRLKSVTLTFADIVGKGSMEWVINTVLTRIAPTGDGMNEQEVENEIVRKNLNAPRITPEMVNDNIVGEEYHVFDGTTVTICLLTLANGFSVTGESACASIENFDEELGQKIARDNAKDKIWGLMGYTLKEGLIQQLSDEEEGYELKSQGVA